MRTFFILLGRELRSTFYSPIAYVVIFFFLFAFGLTFSFGVLTLNGAGPAGTEVTVVEVAFNTVLFWVPFLLVFPLITMRTYSDEFRMGTFEMMTTAPVLDWQIVASKFLGAFLFYVLLWMPTLINFSAFQWITGKEAVVGWGGYVGTYLMLALVGGFYISIGCLASALNKEQVSSAIMCFAAIFLTFVSSIVIFIPGFQDPLIRQFISYISPIEHMATFSRGIIDSRPIIFYLSMTALVLFINFHVFQRRKWKA